MVCVMSLSSCLCKLDAFNCTGTGLSDGFPSGGVDAHESNKFILQLPYDIMAIGKCVL